MNKTDPSSNVNLLGLQDFQKICLLSDRELISLLASGALTTCTGRMGELLVNIEEITQESLSKSLICPKEIEISDSEKSAVEEIISAEILKAMDSIIDEAIALVKIWQKNSNT